jgi:hypothetical protein
MKRGDYITLVDSRWGPCKSCLHGKESKFVDWEAKLEIFMLCKKDFYCEKDESCNGYKNKVFRGPAKIINYIQNLFKI